MGKWDDMAFFILYMLVWYVDKFILVGQRKFKKNLEVNNFYS